VSRRATGDHVYHQPPRNARRMRARTPALPGGFPANPTRGEALGLERGARRATGYHAYHQPPRNARRMRAGTPALPGGGGLPIPRVEMRSSPSAEPVGRRGTMSITSPAQRSPDAGEDARAPRGVPCQSHAWRGARPRARSPSGDGVPCLSPAPAQRSPDAGEDARAPRDSSALGCLRGLESRSPNAPSLMANRCRVVPAGLPVPQGEFDRDNMGGQPRLAPWFLLPNGTEGLFCMSR
jgi:hypothetical protein